MIVAAFKKIKKYIYAQTNQPSPLLSAAVISFTPSQAPLVPPLQLEPVQSVDRCCRFQIGAPTVSSWVGEHSVAVSTAQPALR